MTFVCIRPSVHLSIIAQSTEKVLVAFDGLHRRAFGPLTESDEHVLDKISRGEPVDEAARLLRWLTTENLAETVTQSVLGRPQDWPEDWSRQLSAYSTFAGIAGALEVHKKVTQSHVMIVGVGGIGSHIVQHLLRIGVSSFTLVDPDEVEGSNLNRQVLYKKQDIGLPKVRVAEAYIRQHSHNNVTVYTVQKDFLELAADSDSMRSIDLGIVSADSAPVAIYRHAARMFYPRGIRYGFASYSGDCGKLGPLVFDSTRGCGCCNYLTILVEDGLRKVEGTGIPRIPASSFAVNAMLGAMFVESWVRSLMGKSPDPRIMRFSMRDFTSQSLNDARLPSCPVCGDQND